MRSDHPEARALQELLQLGHDVCMTHRCRRKATTVVLATDPKTARKQRVPLCDRHVEPFIEKATKAKWTVTRS